MLTVDVFKKSLNNSHSSFWLNVVVSASDEHQFYLVGNGGMGTTISSPIEQCSPEIKRCVLEMLACGELVKEDKATLLLDRNILVHFLIAPAEQEKIV